MNYRKDKYGRELSVLGYGCMRFSRKGPGIDLEKAEKEILAAIRGGINYFDTAYIYPGSEEALGTILERNHVRDKVYIATKLPQYLVKNSSAIDRYFEEQKKRLKTDHIDYYLMHMMTDIASWENLDRLGIRDWIRRKKQSGEITNIGFSFHGNTEMFLKILDAYDWDFCQIQYNYLDVNSQAGKKGLLAAEEKGIPVIIMEPLRGGKLVSLLPEAAKRLIRQNERGYSPAEWAFRWLYDQSGVTTVLSGMNSMEMLKENLRIASQTEPGSLTREDHILIKKIRKIILSRIKVGCTECRYCMPCPQGVDIPGLFRCYNTMYTESKRAGRNEYFQTTAIRREPSFATQCVGCKKCESHCPQHLPIVELLKEADREVRPLPYRAAMAVARKFMFRK
ncbi:MAG: aldo/keto reductase [Lachnospiraceae bacterium]|nr:aldo/keto reductase [Lachnospiraceae bacterium]